MGGRSQEGAVWGFPCTHGISLRPQRSLLGARRPGLSTQHQAGAGDQHIPGGTTLPTLTLQTTQQRISAATGSPQPFSPFPGCAPHPTLTNPNFGIFSLSLTQPLAPGVLCLRAEQFTALSCKITCANANRINLPTHKAEDTWDGAKSQQSSSLADTSG